MAIIISMVFLGLLFDEPGRYPKSTMYLFLVSFGHVVVLTLANYFICKAHPRSVWFTPFICNVIILSSMLFEIPWWTRSLMVWIILGIGIALSIIGAIIVARLGRRRIMQEK